MSWGTASAPGETLAEVFGGRLRRDRRGWYWIDDPRAIDQRILDLRPAQAGMNYRIRESGGEHWVEVPTAASGLRPELAWVARLRPTPVEVVSGDWLSEAGVTEGTAALAGVDLAEAPRVYLVPLDRWEEWAASAVLGATWDSQHDAEIQQTARDLGWGPGRPRLDPVEETVRLGPLRVPASMRAGLEAEANRSGRSLSEEIRAALAAWLADRSLEA